MIPDSSIEGEKFHLLAGSPTQAPLKLTGATQEDYTSGLVQLLFVSLGSRSWDDGPGGLWPRLLSERVAHLGLPSIVAWWKEHSEGLGEINV